MLLAGRWDEDTELVAVQCLVAAGSEAGLTTGQLAPLGASLIRATPPLVRWIGSMH
jgi:hypothetical protein